MRWNLLAIKCLLYAVFCLTLSQAAYANSTEVLENDVYSISSQVENYENESVATKAEQALTALDPKNILDSAIESLMTSIKVWWQYFMYIFAIILINAIFACISDGFGNESIFEFVSMLFLVSITLIPIGNCIDYVIECTSRLCTFMTSFIPSMTVIYTAGGSTSTAASSAIICGSAITILQLIGTHFVIPGAKICICLTAISGLSKSVNLSGVSAFIKSCCMWLSGMIMTLFCGILSIQTSLQTGADTLALKGIKFSAARLIPVAGGMLSESLKTVLSGVSFIRGISGALGIAFIIYVIIPPLTAIVSFKLICAICSVLSKLTGSTVQCTYLEGINSALTLLLSIVLCCAVSFIIMLAIFMKTAVNI